MCAVARQRIAQIGRWLLPLTAAVSALFSRGASHSSSQFALSQPGSISLTSG